MQLISWIAQIHINSCSHYSPPSYLSTRAFLAKYHIIFILILNVPFGSTAHKILLLEQHNAITLSFYLLLHSLSVKLVVSIDL